MGGGAVLCHSHIIFPLLLGDSFAAVSTEGLLIYSIDSGAMFTPYDLSLDVTVEGVEAASASGDHLMALVLSFRLNDMTLVSKSMEAVAIGDGA